MQVFVTLRNKEWTEPDLRAKVRAEIDSGELRPTTEVPPEQHPRNSEYKHLTKCTVCDGGLWLGNETDDSQSWRLSLSSPANTKPPDPELHPACSGHAPSKRDMNR